MKEWIPFLQSLVWPVFIGILICIYKTRFEEILKSIKERIDAGSSVDISSSGISIGQLPDNPKPEEMIDDEETQVVTPELMEKEKALERKLSNNSIEKLQLVHSTRFLKVKNGRDYYRIMVSLDPYNTEALSKVDKVVYFLHKTFRNPVREIKDRYSNFELRTAAWGEFTIRAEVYLNGQSEPLRLSRYLDIKTR